MKKKTFKVGDRVLLLERSDLETHNEYEDDDTCRGEVLSISEEGKFKCKWDQVWGQPNPSDHTAEELISEKEADKILSKLEKEYEAWASPIRKKMEEAAKLLEQAGKMADKQGRELAEMHEVVGPLISAMDNLGWRTSSLSC